jgi:hypothetical protein
MEDAKREPYKKKLHLKHTRTQKPKQALNLFKKKHINLKKRRKKKNNTEKQNKTKPKKIKFE